MTHFHPRRRGAASGPALSQQRYLDRRQIVAALGLTAALPALAYAVPGRLRAATAEDTHDQRFFQSSRKAR